jgi:hypothetical protein
VEQLFALAGTLIVILLGIVGFWIQKWIKSTDALTEAIQNLKILFATSQTTMTNLEKHCEARCKLVDDRLKSHSGILHGHTTDIELLKQHHK